MEYQITSNSELTNLDLTGFAGVMALMGGIWLFLILALSIFSIICMWRIFVKAGKPGWASIVPIYNTIVLLDICGLQWWYLLLMLIPIVNIVILILMYVKLAEVFGRSGGFAIGLIFLNIIFMAILAFGPASYNKIPEKVIA